VCSENPACAEVQGNLRELTKEEAVNHKALSIFAPTCASPIIVSNAYEVLARHLFTRSALDLTVKNKSKK